MSDGKTQNINITGGNIGGLQVGDNNTQNITQHVADELRPEAVFEAVAEQLPPEVVEDTVEPLKAMACMPLDQIEQPAIKAKAANLVERLMPYAPQIAKGVVAFTEAALTALASRNPIVAGVLAVCRSAKSESKQE